MKSRNIMNEIATRYMVQTGVAKNESKALSMLKKGKFDLDEIKGLVELGVKTLCEKMDVIDISEDILRGGTVSEEFKQKSRELSTGYRPMAEGIDFKKTYEKDDLEMYRHTTIYEAHIMDTLKEIHDAWVRKNAGKLDQFVKNGKEEIFRDFEAAGFNEAMRCFSLLAPVLERANSGGYRIREHDIKEDYDYMKQSVLWHYNRDGKTTGWIAEDYKALKQGIQSLTDPVQKERVMSQVRKLSIPHSEYREMMHEIHLDPPYEDHVQVMLGAKELMQMSKEERNALETDIKITILRHGDELNHFDEKGNPKWFNAIISCPGSDPIIVSEDDLGKLFNSEAELLEAASKADEFLYDSFIKVSPERGIGDLCQLYDVYPSALEAGNQADAPDISEHEKHSEPGLGD